MSAARRLRKQVTVILVLLMVFGGIAGLISLVSVLSEEPPPPPPPPPPTYEPLRAVSTAIFRVTAGRADLFALVRNPNAGAGARSVEYAFEVQSGGALSARVPGEAFFLPGQEKPLLALNVPAPPPGSALTVRFGDPDWAPVSPGFQSPSFATVSRSTRILDGPTPLYEVKGVLANESDLDYLVVEVSALGLAGDGSIVGAGKTFVGSLRAKERREYTVSWPLPPGRAVATVRVYPDVNLFSPLAVQPRAGTTDIDLPRGR